MSTTSKSSSAAQGLRRHRAGPRRDRPDAVNESMIRHWCEAMGDRNPAYTDAEAAKRSVHGGIVAPPTMLQAWMLGGIEMADPPPAPKNKQTELHKLLSEYGYTSVVATNCEQAYTRYLRPGDRVTATTTIESISEEKATGLGIGYFINTRDDFRDQHDEESARSPSACSSSSPHSRPSRRRRAGGAPAKPTRLRAPRAHDNAWWWEGIDRGELLIQKCSECGRSAIRRARCAELPVDEWTASPRKGGGTVYSYVVLHHPTFPGYDYPLPVAVIELDEGTRIVSNVVGCEPDDVRIGMRVRLSIENVDDELKLPLFRPAA